MSIVSSESNETTRRPPFYGPDLRYVPPIDDGFVLPDPLPGHLELPEENGEFAQSFRETPQGILLDLAIWRAGSRPVGDRTRPQHRPRVGHTSRWVRQRILAVSWVAPNKDPNGGCRAPARRSRGCNARAD
jgi:hypothetical protein